MDDERKNYIFTWTIENFNWKLPEIGNKIIDSECLASPNFTLYIQGNTQWFLELYPKTGRSGAFIKCLPVCNEYPRDLAIDCHISILDENDSVYLTKEIKCKCSALFHCDFSNALEVERSKLPLRRDLIIQCRISYSDDNSENQFTLKDVEDLSLDMSNLYAGQALSDLQLCNGKEKLHVHRSILCIRAPKFAEELGIQDDDFPSKIEVITIPFSVLKVLMVYIYTGKVGRNIYGIMDDLYEIAKKYNLEHLKYELLPTKTHSLVTTKIISSKEQFTWKVRNISSMKHQLTRLIDLQLSRFIITLTPELPGRLQLSFKITSFPMKKESVYLNCKINLTNKEGKLIKFSDHVHLFESDTRTKRLGIISKEKWEYPALFKINDLKLNDFITNNTLNLEFELEITEGEKKNEIVCINNSLKTSHGEISHMRFLSYDLLNIFKVKNRPGIGGEYYEDDCYNDIILKSEGKNIECHKSILNARSRVFAKQIDSTKKSKPQELEITDVDYETLLLVVQYMYSGVIKNVAATEIARVYIAAEKYQITGLLKKCRELLSTSLTVQNVCEVLVLADKYKTDDLLDAVYQFMKDNKAEVLNSDEWKSLVDTCPVLTTTVFSKICGQQQRRQAYDGSRKQRRFRLIP